METLHKFLDIEDSREQSVNTRAGVVVVFGGVVLSLLVSIGRVVLGKDLPDGWDEATVALFAAAILSLLAAVSLTLFFVLVPRQSASIAMEEIERYGELDILAQPRIEVQGVLLEGLIRLLAIDRGAGVAENHMARACLRRTGFGPLRGWGAGPYPCDRRVWSVVSEKPKPEPPSIPAA